MEQVTGVEPALFVWKTKVLPLHHACGWYENNMVLKQQDKTYSHPEWHTILFCTHAKQYGSNPEGAGYNCDTRFCTYAKQHSSKTGCFTQFYIYGFAPMQNNIVLKPQMHRFA